MQHRPALTPLPSDDARTPRPAGLPAGLPRLERLALRVERLALLALLLVVALVIFFLCTQAYTAHQWGALKPGMTRSQVDQKLWAFGSYPSQYSGLGPGEFVIRYELFRMGKLTMIQVIFNPDGTVADAQPIYDI
jgi:hypothetical protein